MLPALASVSDASAFGLTVTQAALLRASTRVRSHLGQRITAGTSTVTLRGPLGRLPQRPVSVVTSVLDEDGNDVDFDLLAGGALQTNYGGTLTVEYDHGYAAGAVPDELVELVCTIAARLGTSDPALAAGVQQEQSGSASQTFGWDAWKGLTSLTAEEKSALSRMFPRVPRVIVMQP